MLTYDNSTPNLLSKHRLEQAPILSSETRRQTLDFSKDKEDDSNPYREYKQFNTVSSPAKLKKELKALKNETHFSYDNLPQTGFKNPRESLDSGKSSSLNKLDSPSNRPKIHKSKL